MKANSWHGGGWSQPNRLNSKLNRTIRQGLREETPRLTRGGERRPRRVMAEGRKVGRGEKRSGRGNSGECVEEFGGHVGRDEGHVMAWNPRTRPLCRAMASATHGRAEKCVPGTMHGTLAFHEKARNKKEYVSPSIDAREIGSSEILGLGRNVSKLRVSLLVVPLHPDGGIDVRPRNISRIRMDMRWTCF